MRRSTIMGFGIAIAAVATASLVVPAAFASGHDDALSGVRSATRQYRKVERAIDAGYVQFFGCVHEPLAGSMGIHFVNGALAGDGAIDAVDTRSADVRSQAERQPRARRGRVRGLQGRVGRHQSRTSRAVRSDVQHRREPEPVWTPIRSTNCTPGRGSTTPREPTRTTTRRCCAPVPKATRTSEPESTASWEEC